MTNEETTTLNSFFGVSEETIIKAESAIEKIAPWYFDLPFVVRISDYINEDKETKNNTDT